MIYLYSIYNKISHGIYIGQTNRLNNRKRDHFESLRQNNHGNGHLQSSYNLYGREAFDFSIIEECEDRESANVAEKFLIEYLRFLSANVYNIRSGGNAGSLFPPETKAKWSMIRKGRKPSPQSIIRHKITIQNQSPEVKKARALAISKVLKGRIPSAQHRAALSAALKGRRPAPHVIEASRRAHLGSSMPLKTRLALDKARRGRKHTPEEIAKMSAAAKGRPSPLRGVKRPSEVGRKISIARMGIEPWNKGKYGDELLEYRRHLHSEA